jgi:transcriptional regulator PpsR
VRAFENPEETFGKVTAEIFARVMGQVSDMALVITAADGIIRDVAFGTSDLAAAGLGGLIGRAWIDVVTEESRGKVESLLAGASPDGRWRHLNFPTSGDDVPISFQAFGLGGGRLLAVGRDERQSAIVQRRFIAAQREVQESFARLQQADMRFHTMLELSDLAVLTLNGDKFEILDINNVAADLLPGNARDLVGRSFLSLLDKAEGARAEEALVRAVTTGRIGSFSARLRGGRDAHFQLALFRYEHAARLLVRLLDHGEHHGDNSPAGGCSQALFAELPHGVVITGEDMRIVDVNRAFVDLAQLSVEDNALGQPLERFLGRNGVDTAILAAALRDHASVRNFATVLTGTFGAVTEIDVDAVHVSFARRECFGFFIRVADRGRRRPVIEGGAGSGFVDRVTEVVGRVSLKDIVRDTTDEIERLCIETALGMTDNNRAAAAEMLGISRQSLYGKLARYGIGNPDNDDD